MPDVRILAISAADLMRMAMEKSVEMRV
jgi:hypothetical protein